MTQFKGTPGPWRVSEKHGDLIDIRHENNEPGAMSLNLAQVVARQSWLKEAEANARLIAAAPELLEALRDMVALVKSRAYPQPDKPSSDWGRAEAAEDVIRKATGETK